MKYVNDNPNNKQKTTEPQSLTTKVILWQPRVVKRGTKPQDNTEFELQSAFRPSSQDIRQAQEQLGYPLNGYGVPFDVQPRELLPGIWRTRWYALRSCE
jgi:hypothetical protein